MLAAAFGYISDVRGREEVRGTSAVRQDTGGCEKDPVGGRVALVASRSTAVVGGDRHDHRIGRWGQPDEPNPCASLSPRTFIGSLHSPPDLLTEVVDSQTDEVTLMSIGTRGHTMLAHALQWHELVSLLK
jgi:hypothetical protein